MDYQTLEQVAKRGCRASILEDIQDPDGHSPEHSAVGDPALSGGVTAISRGAFPPLHVSE